MSALRDGDRIRIELNDDDGMPLIRYGFVAGVPHGVGPIVVMLDGDLSGTIVDPSEVRRVELTTVELCLRGEDLIDDPELRRGLVGLWQAEADAAGLDVGGVRPIADGLRREDDSWVLAELSAGDEIYVVHAFRMPGDAHTVCVRADPARRPL